MSKTATVKLTAAIGIAGQLIRAGTIVTIPEAAAKNLLYRGKAELATEEDGLGDEFGDEGEAETAAAAEQPAAESAAQAKGKKK